MCSCHVMLIQEMLSKWLCMLLMFGYLFLVIYYFANKPLKNTTYYGYIGKFKISKVKSKEHYFVLLHQAISNDLVIVD